MKFNILPRCSTPRLWCLVVAAGFSLCSPSAKAASPSIWNGAGGDDFWQNPANWGGNVPVSSTTYDLQFGGGTRLTATNNFDVNSQFRAITFNAGADPFVLSGSSIRLYGDVTNNSSNLQTINLNMALEGVGARTFNAASGNLAVGGGISGTQGLNKTGAGTLTLSNANTLSGNLVTGAGSGAVILAHSLAAQNATLSTLSTSSTNQVSFAAGIGSFTIGNIRSTANLVLEDVASQAVALTLQGGAGESYTGILSGSGSVIANLGVAGSQTFGNNNTYSGGTTLNSGTLMGRSTTTAFGTGSLTINGGTLGFDRTNGTAQTQTVTSLSGNGGVITITGFAHNATLIVNSALNTSFAGAIQNGVGVMTFTKQGVGSLTLTGSHSYTGNTTVSAGTLLIDGSTHAGSAVSVGNTAILAGSGTIGGATTINAGGTLAPGSSPGVLTIDSSLTFASDTSQANFEIATGARGTTYDGVNVDGLLTYDGVLTLTMTSLVANTIYNLFEFGSETGSFDSIAFAGGAYSGSFSNDGFGVWTAESNEGQTFIFTQSTGDLIVVPEAHTAALLFLGLGLAALRSRRSLRQAGL